MVTTSLSAARDITAAARPPRAAFVDFPHGHTSGRLEDPTLSEQLVRSALALTSGTDETLVDLPHRWADTDAWKNEVFAPKVTEPGAEPEMVDDRQERHDSPQYQEAADAEAAEASHAGQDCLVCAGIDI